MGGRATRVFFFFGSDMRKAEPGGGDKRPGKSVYDGG